MSAPIVRAATAQGLCTNRRWFASQDMAADDSEELLNDAVGAAHAAKKRRTSRKRRRLQELPWLDEEDDDEAAAANARTRRRAIDSDADDSFSPSNDEGDDQSLYSASERHVKRSRPRRSSHKQPDESSSAASSSSQPRRLRRLSRVAPSENVAKKTSDSRDERRGSTTKWRKRIRDNGPASKRQRSSKKSSAADVFDLDIEDVESSGSEHANRANPDFKTPMRGGTTPFIDLVEMDEERAQSTTPMRRRTPLPLVSDVSPSMLDLNRLSLASATGKSKERVSANDLGAPPSTSAITLEETKRLMRRARRVLNATDAHKERRSPPQWLTKRRRKVDEESIEDSLVDAPTAPVKAPGNTEEPAADKRQMLSPQALSTSLSPTTPSGRPLDSDAERRAPLCLAPPPSPLSSLDDGDDSSEVNHADDEASLPASAANVGADNLVSGGADTLAIERSKYTGAGSTPYDEALSAAPHTRQDYRSHFEAPEDCDAIMFTQMSAHTQADEAEHSDDMEARRHAPALASTPYDPNFTNVQPMHSIGAASKNADAWRVASRCFGKPTAARGGVKRAPSDEIVSAGDSVDSRELIDEIECCTDVRGAEDADADDTIVVATPLSSGKRRSQTRAGSPPQSDAGEGGGDAGRDGDGNGGVCVPVVSAEQCRRHNEGIAQALESAAREYEEARNENAMLAARRAATSVRVYALPIQNAADALRVPGIGHVLAARVAAHLRRSVTHERAYYNGQTLTPFEPSDEKRFA